MRWLGVGMGVAVTALLAGPADGEGQASGVMDLPRLTGPVVVDGVPDEAAWQAIDPLPLVMYFPTFRGTPAQRTEIRVAYDDRYLYAAGHFYDDDPSGIRINSLYRDRWNGDDAFAIYVDAFNDNQTAKWFGTTASAMRFDLLVTDDGATLNGSWNTFWHSETTVTEEGWFAEVRIPFSSLGFQTDAADEAVLGLTVTRLVSRTGERVTFPAIDPQFPFRQPSAAQDVRIRGVQTDRPAYFTPFVTSAVERTAGAAAGDPAATVHQTEVGLDLRYSLASNLVLDVTANTDFAQVEADDQQVNLDRFSLFFPEKRRFFQEGSGLFDFVMGGGTRLFHSRRIGLTPANEPVPVLGGARVVGRVGEWDVGALNMQTERFGSDPTENFGVARIRRRAFNDFSTIGGMFTSRVTSGREQISTGFDSSVRVSGDHYWTAKWAATNGGGSGLLDATRFYTRWERRASRGLLYQMTYTYSGPDFAPAMGFAPRSDVTRANFLANYFIFTDDHRFFRRVWPGMLAFSTFRNTDRSLESGQYAVWLQWETKSGGGGWIEPKYFVEDVATPFSIGGEVTIPAGRHEYADLQLVWSMPAGRRLRASVDARAGSFFDGQRVQVIANPTWNVSPRLELGAAYQWTRLRFDDRLEQTDIHLARVRVRTAWDSRASANVFLQYNSTTDRLDVNGRLRYNFAEGQDLWVVLNEGLRTERRPDPTQPLLPFSTARTLIVKYTHTWGG